jgi:hypothetical protein
MVYLKANLWNLKMHAATVFGGGGGGEEQQPMMEKYFKEK